MIKKRSRKRKVVVVINNPVEKGIAFDKWLDEIAAFAGPSAVWAGFENKLEVVALAVFWFILCKAWSVRIRRNSK